jgi:hypothetical protein
VNTGRRVRQGCCLSPILFKLYSEYLTKEAVEGVGDIQTVQVIGTVKEKYDLVILAKEETVRQSMINRANGTGRRFAMKMNVE